MIIYRGTFVDCPADPFAGGGVRAWEGGLAVEDGTITARGTLASLAAEHPDADVVDLGGGLVIPGLVDTHVHFPQIRVIGALDMPLLEWLERRALPEEAKMADAAYARAVASEFVGALLRAGTTSALVFGAHFAGAVEELFTAAETAGLRVTSGLVVSDRELPEPLLTTPARALAESVALGERWHGRGRLRYAVTPRFSLSCTDALLGACAEARAGLPGAMFTSHVNENPDEIAFVESHFGCDYTTSYDRHGLLDAGSVLAHNVHARPVELALLAGRGTAVAHCPRSNAVLASGSFDFAAHNAAGVPVALGTDVGAGVSFSLLGEALQACLMQRLRGASGLALSSAHLLWLATRAGALALGLDEVGDFEVGHRFDAAWVRPEPGAPLDIALRHADDAPDALAKLFALAETADIKRVFVDGAEVWRRC